MERSEEEEGGLFGPADAPGARGGIDKGENIAF